MTNSPGQAQLSPRRGEVLDELYAAVDEYERNLFLDSTALEAAVAAIVASDLTLDERVAVADGLRDQSARCGRLRLAALAAQIAPVPDFLGKARRFRAAYRAYQPHAALGGSAVPTPEARRRLRAATSELLAARPRCPNELGIKTKACAAIGANAAVRRACPRPDPHAARLFAGLWGPLAAIPAWFFAAQVGYPFDVAECDRVHRGGSFVADAGAVDEVIDAAGPLVRRPLDDDVALLVALRAGQDAR